MAFAVVCHSELNCLGAPVVEGLATESGHDIELPAKMPDSHQARLFSLNVSPVMAPEEVASDSVGTICKAFLSRHFCSNSVKVAECAMIAMLKSNEMTRRLSGDEEVISKGSGCDT